MQTDIHSIIRDYGKVYKQYSEFMRTEIHSIIWEKYSEFMWIEIHSIIQKISILCSACVIKINIGTNHGFFFTKISISCELCSVFVIIIKAHKGNVVTGHGFF